MISGRFSLKATLDAEWLSKTMIRRMMVKIWHLQTTWSKNGSRNCVMIFMMVLFLEMAIFNGLQVKAEGIMYPSFIIFRNLCKRSDIWDWA